MVIFLMGMEDHQEGGMDIQEQVVNLWVEVDPQVAKDLEEEVEANFWLEV
jgi:hypothetical protein